MTFESVTRNSGFKAAVSFFHFMLFFYLKKWQSDFAKWYG
jgi:hypothetical protein